MLRLLRRRKHEPDKPLYYKLATKLKMHGTPMTWSSLVDLFEAEYGRETVHREIELMVEAGLLIKSVMQLTGTFGLPPCMVHVGLPAQCETPLGLTA